MAKHNRKNSDVDVKELREDVDRVKSKMRNNIEKVLERGELLEELDDETKDLPDKSKKLRDKSVALRNQLRWQNYAYYAVGLGALGGLGFGAILGLSAIFTGLSVVGGGAIGYIGGWLINKASGLFSSTEKKESELTKPEGYDEPRKKLYTPSHSSNPAMSTKTDSSHINPEPSRKALATP
jgi:hypothetical protein